MKTTTTAIGLLFCFMMSLFFVQNATAQTTEKDELEKVKIKVKELQWEKEKADALELKLEEMEGVKKAYVCHIRARAKVKYYPSLISEDEIVEAIDDEGYEDYYVKN